MKKLSYILIAALTLLAVACNPKEEGGGDKPGTLSVSPASLSFAADPASPQSVTVSASGSWTATVTESWVQVAPSSGSGNGTLSISVSTNTSDARAAKLKIVSGSLSKEVFVSQAAGQSAPVEIVPKPAAFDGNKRASTTYQLLIYTFADSDGDGVGDFKGIQNKLDYLNDLGVTALWLSPAHPASSYHAYDVTDYNSLNPLYAVGEKTSAKAEADFKDLLAAAHEKNIAIYMDYVLNHSSKYHPWFQDAVSNASSPYRDYYFFSANPSADYNSFPMLKGTSYQSGEWKLATSGSPKLSVTKTEEDVTTGNCDWNLWVWKSGQEGKAVKFVNDGNGNYHLVMDLSGSYGILLRKYMNWDAGSKFGAQAGSSTLTDGGSLDLVAEGGDISFSGNGRYRFDLTNVSTETLFYMGCFSDWMPDFNYGDVSVAENNACFQDLAASADKWIMMGVDGLRLDAVKHICGGINSYNNSSNHTLLSKWYDHCNDTYKAAGHNGNIFMVAEAWGGHEGEEQYYYKSLTSCFEFDYGYKVRDILNSGSASNFVSAVAKYVSDHNAQRADAITSFFLSNHDQDRFASNVSRKEERLKQAAAILLSGPGKPFIYQGEELGYWGTKDSGDEKVRQPMAWNASLTDLAKLGLTLDRKDKTDYNIVKGDISVEKQLTNSSSLLNVYKTWSQLRNSYPALANGQMTKASLQGNSIAAWYMTSGNQKLLVIHNVSPSGVAVSVSDKMDKPIALLGTATVKDKTLNLGGNSSVVFEL